MPAFQGKIEVIFGPMFSGKSTELQRRLRREQLAKRKVLAINHSSDSRYTTKNELSTHDKIKMDCIKISALADIPYEYINEHDIIGIDEGQFFTDLVEKSEEWANMGKKIIIACLDGDFNREDFNNVSLLLCKAEDIVKLSAICKLCGDNAYFTKAKINLNEGNIKIGGEETYISTCRYCYFN